MFFGSKKNGATDKAAPTTKPVAETSSEPVRQKATIPDVRTSQSPLAAGQSNASSGPRVASAGAGQMKPSEQARRRAVVGLRRSVAFAQIVTVLIRSPQHKHLALADLEWLVFPPLSTGQFAVANVQAEKGGAGLPAAVALWASVSAEVDRKLAENLTAPMRLRPDEWKSGEILWLIEAIGEPRVTAGLLKELSDKTFKNRPVRMRVRGKDGKPAVRTLVETISTK